MRDRSRNVEEALPPGTRIEEFEIERALQSGGFGVTYLARDRSLERRVAIKEYLPREWGGRRSDGSVGPRSSSHAKDYRWGLTRFLEEARTLARLDHPRIVRVHRVIEAWGTAYMVMEYVEGRNLEEALKAEGPWPEERVRGLLDSLLPGLAQVHAAGLIHRDIKPANVMLRADGTPVLIDFGAARYAAGAHSHSLTSVLTPGYAPFEQYQTGGKQGAWTDVYALGAVAYRALSGQTPVEATARVRADPLAPVSAAAGGVSESFGAAVTSALAVWTEDRPQDVTAWRARWDAGAVHAPSPSPSLSSSSSPAPSPPPSPAVPSPPQGEEADLPASDKVRGSFPKTRRLRLAAGLAALVLAAGVAVWLIVDQRPADAPSDGGRVADLQPGGAVPPPVPPDPAEAEEALGLDRATWRLVQLGLAGAEFDPGVPDGDPGPGTRAALERWQQARGAGVTGYLDAESMRELLEAGRRAEAEAEERRLAEEEERRLAEAEAEENRVPIPPDVSPEAAEEALGLDRAGWRRIQEGLVALGLDPGTPDGLAGGGTRRAVRAYQEGAGKPATGFVDAADVTALHAAAAEADRVVEQRAAEEAERRAAAEAERRAAADAERRAAEEAERRRAEEAAADAERRRLAELRRPGRVFRDCDACPEMVVIPAGAFQMGSRRDDDEADDDERPRHRVSVEPFALGRYEVTRAEYAAFVTATGHHVPGGCYVHGYTAVDNSTDVWSIELSEDGTASWRSPGFAQGGDHPVVCVNWRDAQAFVEWLSRETGEQYRLPSEAEWEYAARAGTATRRWWGNEAGAQCEYGNGSDATYEQEVLRRFRDVNWNGPVECTDGSAWTAPVGSFSPNDFGLHDVLGNVKEWVEDCWHETYARAPADGSAWTSGGNCVRRVLRGGSWGDGPRRLRSAYRTWSGRGRLEDRTGFRVSRTLD